MGHGVSRRINKILNPRWFGDSFDIVKRFFIKILKDAGYEVYVEPMFTGDWEDNEHRFISFIGVNEGTPTSHKSALFIDPDTGIGNRTTSRHITICCGQVKSDTFC
jgi:hypothetical protein